MRRGPHGVGCRGAPACAGGAGSRNCSTEDIDRPTWWAYSAPYAGHSSKPDQLYVHVCGDHERRGRPPRRCGPGLGAFRCERKHKAPNPGAPTASRACQPSVLPFSNAPRRASSVFSHRIGSWFLPSFEPSPLPTPTRMAYVEVRAAECPELAVGLRPLNTSRQTFRDGERGWRVQLRRERQSRSRRRDGGGAAGAAQRTQECRRGQVFAVAVSDHDALERRLDALDGNEPDSRSGVALGR